MTCACATSPHRVIGTRTLVTAQGHLDQELQLRARVDHSGRAA
uniref:Uncharacterized protein n=1 Tax=uncultured Nocardioidaceae bacterium TaxID=253824 RepID=A0A6J4MCC0_9ACTN|nr:MAG: hypothetical protein AVDCRST_MAG46-2823 [uncultured Nocardioidaceae bacterium]